MLRGGEALALTWGDVQVLAEGLQLHILFSKTDQRGDGAFILLGLLPGCPLSPSTLFQEWQAAAGSAPVGSAAPLFPVKGGGRAVAKDTMLGRLRRLLQSLGLTREQAMQYGLHSLRRGGATAAARSGAPLRMIAEHGRWRSDCVREYAYADEEERWGMTAAMVAGATL